MLYVDDQPSLLPQPSALLSRRRAIGGGRACCPGWCSWTGPPRTRTTSPLGPWISAARTRRTASRLRSNSRSAEIQASNVTQDTGGVEHAKLYGYDEGQIEMMHKLGYIFSREIVKRHLMAILQNNSVPKCVKNHHSRGE